MKDTTQQDTSFKSYCWPSNDRALKSRLHHASKLPSLMGKQIIYRRCAHLEECKEETLSIFTYILYWGSEIVSRGKMDATGSKLRTKAALVLAILKVWFTLPDSYFIWWPRYKYNDNMKTSTLLHIHTYFTYSKTPYIAYKGQKNKCIYTLPDSNIIWEYNSRNIIYAFEPLVPCKSRILLRLQILITGLHTINSTTTKWNNLQLQATCKFHLWMSRAEIALYRILSVFVCPPVNFLLTHHLHWTNLQFQIN
jgi:hypothetical protein